MAGDIPAALTQGIAREAADRLGVELTPAQAGAKLRELLADVRRHLRDRGHAVPEDDNSLMILMAEAHGRR